MAFQGRHALRFSRRFSHFLFSVNPPKQFERACFMQTTASSFSFSTNKSRTIIGVWDHHPRWFGTAAAHQDSIETEFWELLESKLDKIEGTHSEIGTNSKQSLVQVSVDTVQKHASAEIKNHFGCFYLLEEREALSNIKNSYALMKEDWSIWGPCHYWLNMEDGRKVFSKDGIFLTLVNAYIQDSFASGIQLISMLEKLKLLQQRFPELQTFGLQCATEVPMAPIRNQISKMIINENITFPILLSTMEFMPANNEAFYLLFDGFGKSVSCFRKDAELANIINEISQLDMRSKESSTVLNSKSTWVKHSEIIKEPSTCSYLKNLLLDFAGCISVDESNNRIFFSDTNHHRIIVTSGNGHILDCIGSSPGFEDGGFDTAKMMRPASSLYNATEDCLYFVDSDNHAVRCANLEKRVVHTLYPAPESNKNAFRLWRWLLVKLGIMQEASEKNQEHDMGLLCFPWHILKSQENNLFITNRSFDCLWVLCTNTGHARLSYEGFEDVLDFCKPIVMTRLSLVEKMHDKQCLQHRTSSIFPEELAYANLMSSVAKLGERLLLCDSWQIIQFQQCLQDFSCLEFSNLGLLGVPYWLECPLERVFPVHHRDAYVVPSNRLLHNFDVQPGRCDIKIRVGLPDGTRLAAPVQDGSFWCQTKGCAIEVSRSEVAATLKVGVAQQFYDELDDLAFDTVNTARDVDKEEQDVHISHQEDILPHIDCSVDTSPGTSEVVVCAVFYLKLSDAYNNGEVDDAQKAEKILGITSDQYSRKQGKTSLSLLLESHKGLGNIVFMRPLHLRIKLNCCDASTDRHTELVRTDSHIEVNVSLT